MSAPAPPLQEDRPLRRGEEDLLGFEVIAAGLAAQLRATTGGGLLAAITARSAGAGRTSFLNLLNASLLERGVAVLRFAGSDDLDQLLRRARAPLGSPSPVALIDDAEPEQLANLDSPSGAAAIVVAWTPGSEARSAALSPLMIELPRWSERAAECWVDARPAAIDAADRAAWIQLLGQAGTPRRAARLANAALAACSSSAAPTQAMLAALAKTLGLKALPAPGEVDLSALLEHAALFCGALAAERPAALASAEASETIFGAAAQPSLETCPDDMETLGIDETSRESDPDAEPLPEVERRRRRCVELAGRGDGSSTGELLRLLADEHPSVRLSASHALAALADPAAAPELRRMLGSSDASLRRTAAFVLGRLGDEGSREELVRLLVDVTPSARRAAAAALGRLGGEAVVRPLLMALDDQHAGVRMAAETALSRILATLPEGLLDSLARMGDERVRRAAIRAAGRLGFGTRGALESLLHEPGTMAVSAAEALGRRREAGSLPALAEAIAGDRGDLRTAAMEAVGRICDGSTVTGLAGLLSHEEAGVREAAKRALARCPGAYEAVLPFLGQEDEGLRSTAADALGRCGDRRAIGPLLDAHDRGDPQLRRAAAASLVRLGFEP